MALDAPLDIRWGCTHIILQHAAHRYAAQFTTLGIPREYAPGGHGIHAGMPPHTA